jgi:hypothetical protein
MSGSIPRCKSSGMPFTQATAVAMMSGFVGHTASATATRSESERGCVPIKGERLCRAHERGSISGITGVVPTLAIWVAA